VLVAGILAGLMVGQTAPLPEHDAFLSAWESNDFLTACRALDRIPRSEATASSWTHLAVSARRACARAALADANPDLAESQLAAARALGMSAKAGVQLQGRIDVDLAAVHLSRGDVDEAIVRLRRLPPGGLPQSVEHAAVTSGLQAVSERRWKQATRLYDVIAKRTPGAYRLERLRSLLWWHQHGYGVGLWVAGGSLALLLVLLGRTLLRIRRQAQALLRSEG
jgi:hypothetical protein